MARFFGKKNQDSGEVPPELEQYYERDGWRKWVRWIVSILIIAALLFGVFLLARGVYRSVTDDGDSDKNNNTAQNESKNNKESKQKDKNQGSSQDQGSQADTSKPNQNQPSETPSPTTVPRTGDDPSDLPSTGDNPTDQPPATLPSTGG